ncbi:hypothetical protein [Microbispora triticiradicis]|uniref:hypothetical protein n=1 Tax=Microbispora triticiradicis TaxID=2200763 RepID=UPI001AD643CC|nr:hypothetical protein [Microbispora triticiradicis]MBO4269315.1 hypothetical protein [Microbispora triticiradicis]
MSGEDDQLPDSGVAEETGRAVREAIESWPKTARLGVVCLFAAGACAVFYLVTHSSQEEPPQCRVVVVHEPTRVGGELTI